MEKHILSKSSFLKGCQCPKALYMSKHNRGLREEPDAALQAIFTQGEKSRRVGAAVVSGWSRLYTGESFSIFRKRW
jgi:hypothetical protein